MQSNNDDSSLGSLEGGIFEDASTEDHRGSQPLFVYFTCTVKQKGESHHNIVRSMPLCLGESRCVVCTVYCVVWSLTTTF